MYERIIHVLEPFIEEIEAFEERTGLTYKDDESLGNYPFRVLKGHHLKRLHELYKLLCEEDIELPIQEVFAEIDESAEDIIQSIDGED